MDIKSTRKVYSDIWEYHKKYIDVQNNVNFLKSMISDRDVLIKKYTSNDFACRMIILVYNSLLVSWKEKYAPPE